MVVIPIQLDFCHDDEQKSTCVHILHTYIISPKCTLCRLVSRQGNARHFVVVLRVCDEKKSGFQFSIKCYVCTIDYFIFTISF